MLAVIKHVVDDEYRRMNSMYYNNCYPPLPIINMFYAAEDMTIRSALKETMTVVILLLVCCTRICTNCFSFLAISLLFDILYKLRFDNFLLNKDDDDDDIIFLSATQLRHASAHGARNTVKQPRCKLNFISPELWSKQARAELN